MQRCCGPWPLIVACCAAVALFCGCGSWPAAKGPSKKALAIEPPEHLNHLPTPRTRIDQLKQIAKTAPSASAEDQKHWAHELGGEIRTAQDPLVRAEILRTLTVLSDPMAEAVLRAGLSDPDTDVRVTACQCWAKRGGPQATTLLGEAISTDTEVDVRLAAIRALGELGDPSAVQAIGQALEDPDPAMQRRAVLALREVTGQNYGNDVNAWREFVQGGNPQPQPQGIAQRLRQLF